MHPAAFHLLQSLGIAMGHSLWQMAILWMVSNLMGHFLRCNASQRYALAASAALAGVLAFMATFIYYAAQPGAYSYTLPAAGGWVGIQQLHDLPNGLLFVYHSLLATLRSLAPYLSGAYLAIVFILSVRLMNGFKQVNTLRYSGISKPPVDWRLFINHHAPLLGIKRQVQVYLSTVATSPLTIGFFKPIILIPMACVNQLSTHQMEAILLHELSHIRRHDYLLNLALQVAEILLFFNPLMRKLLKTAHQERENSCDDWVLQFKYDAREYATALLALAQNIQQPILALSAQSTQKQYPLLHRVRRMVAPQPAPFNYRQQLGLLTLITLFSLAFTLIVPKPKYAANTAMQQQASPASLVQPAVSKYSLEAPPEATAAKPAFINLLQHIEQARQAIFVASAHPDESLLPEPRFNDTRPIAWEIKDKPLPAENQAIDNQDEPAEPVFAGLEATQSAAANRALTKQLSAIASVKWSDVLEQVEVAVVHNATKASSLPPLKGWVMAADSIKVLPLKELLASLTKLNAKKLTVWETQRLATQPAPVAGTQHHKGLQTQLELREQKIAEANARYQQALANKAAEQMQAAERYLHRQQMVMQRQMEELQQKYLAKALAYEKLSQQQTSNLSYSYNLPDYDEEAMQQRASLYSRAAQAPVARVAVQRSRQAAVPPLKEQTQEPTGWIGADVDDKAIEQAIAATAGTIVVRIADAATEAISKARLELDLHNLARQIQNLAIQMELNANKLSMPAPDSNLQLPPATATPPLTTPAKRRIVHL